MATFNVNNLNINTGGSLVITDTGTNTTTIQQPAMAASLSYSLPTLAGAAQDSGILKYNAGVLSWDTAAAGPAGPNGSGYTLFGTNSLSAGTSAPTAGGTDNTILGVKCLQSAGAASDNNTCVGYNQNPSAATVDSLTAVGARIADGVAWNSSATDNILVGSNMIRLLVKAGYQNNTKIGMESSDGGNSKNNTTIGTRNMILLEGDNHTLIGHESGRFTQVNSLYITTLGHKCDQWDGPSRRVSAIGNQALGSTTTTIDNEGTVAIGYKSMYNFVGTVANESKNVCVGNYSGDLLTTGYANVIIGHNADLNAVGQNNCIVIGDGVTAGSSTNRTMWLPTGLTKVSGGVQVNYDTATGIVYRNSSSQRYKKNITDLEVDLDQVLQLRIREFNYKEEERRHLGLIAEEVAEVLPQLVTWDGDNRPHGIKYNVLSVLLLKHMKNLEDQFNQLKQEAQQLLQQII